MAARLSFEGPCGFASLDCSSFTFSLYILYQNFLIKSNLKGQIESGLPKKQRVVLILKTPLRGNAYELLF